LDRVAAVHLRARRVVSDPVAHVRESANCYRKSAMTRNMLKCALMGSNKRPIQKSPVRDEHLAGVHDVERIEGLFDSSHGVEAARPYLELYER